MFFVIIMQKRPRGQTCHRIAFWEGTQASTLCKHKRKLYVVMIIHDEMSWTIKFVKQSHHVLPQWMKRGVELVLPDLAPLTHSILYMVRSN
jgi:hypothetical protein